MKEMTAREIEEAYGTPASEWDRLEADAMEGRFIGEPRGEVITGRPLLFDEEMRQVSFKEPVSTVAAIDKRASQLDLKRSEYLRRLVAADLAEAGLA